VRRPSWRDPRLLIGLALIALAVAAVVTIVQGADTTTPFYAAARDLAPGTVLAESDLVVVHVRVGSGEYVAQSDAVVGKVLDRTVGEGELVPASALVDPGGYDSRAIAVVSSMPLADGVGVGSLVDVWVTVQADDGPHSSLVGSGLAVTDVREAQTSLGASGTQTVYVAVPASDVAGVLDAVSSGGDVAIVAAGS
jgi:hypothetical protein